MVLIDVREPGEVAQGIIPTSHPIPLANIQEALALPDKEFEARFGEFPVLFASLWRKGGLEEGHNSGA